MSCEWCLDGWVCEEHPENPVGHDGCGAAGAPCTNPAIAHGRAHIKHEERQQRITKERYQRCDDLKRD